MPKTLIQQLIEKGMIDKEKAAALEYEIKSSGEKEEELLIKRKIVGEDFLYGLKSEQMKIPLREVFAADISPGVLELIPGEAAKYYRMVPIARRDKMVDVGMLAPDDLTAREALKFLARKAGFDYQVFLITPTNFNSILKQYRTMRKEVGIALEELEEELKGEKEKKEIEAVSEEEIESMAGEAPVTKIVAVALRHAVEGRASDVHIEPTRDKLRIRFRLDGVLHPSIFLPMQIHPAVLARIKILANLKIDEMRIPQDGRFSVKIGEQNVDFRVSTFPTTLGEKAALRVLNPTEGLKTLDELGLDRRNLQAVKKAITKPYGMVLATGPTGCGKTTTLYAVLRILNKDSVNLMTLEDPVEYYIDGVNQSEIQPEIGYTFAKGLRHILRQSPDVIMVGEIRDEESASLAIHAALTGHLVLSTLHTTTAIGAIPRLLDLKIEPFLLPHSLSVIVAQRLVRKLCPECKEKITASLKIQEMIMQDIEKLPPSFKQDIIVPKPITLWTARGCKICRSTGYSGRLGIFEVIEMTDRLAEIILKDASEINIIQEAKAQGMITMRQDGMLKVLDGVTSIEEVIRATEER